MSPSRSHLLILVATALLGTAGCRTAGLENGVARREMFPNRTNESARELLVEHNRNAEQVTSLEAQPSITVSSRKLMGGVGGRLAMERPKNFSLRLSDPLSEVADIGSNGNEFWFWLKNAPDKHVYYCDYDESGESPLSASLDPDWIIEAMGLRVVSDDEAAKIQVSPGKEFGTLVLTLKNTSKNGDVVWRETVLSESTHRIVEHRVYGPDHKTILARATVSGYQEYPLPAESGEAGAKVFLPSKFKLQWTQEKMALDVSLSKVKVNRAITEVRRNELFNEPKLADFPRKNLGEMAGLPGGANRATASQVPRLDGPTSVRESMPAPPPRVRLNEPAPIGLDGARRSLRDPGRLAADLPPSYARGIEEVVGPQIPTVSEPQPAALAAQSGWKNALSPGVER